MTTPHLNLDLLGATLRAAAQYPEHFDMDSWVYISEDVLPGLSTNPAAPTPLDPMACGTTACLAGWVIHLDPRAELAGYRARHADLESCNPVAAIDGELHGVEHAAAKLLGLTHLEANRLFYARDYDGALRAAWDIARERGRTTAELAALHLPEEAR